MLTFLKEFGDYIVKAVTFDMTAEELKIAGKVFFIAMWRGGIVVFIAMATFGGIFATAGDTDTKIQTAVQPIADAQRQLADTQKGQGVQISSLLTTWNVQLRKTLATLGKKR